MVNHATEYAHENIMPILNITHMVNHATEYVHGNMLPIQKMDLSTYKRSGRVRSGWTIYAITNGLVGPHSWSPRTIHVSV